MINGMPDRERFMAAIGSVITEAAAESRSVRAFGEMVALLWDDGNVAGAIALEALWNELAGSQEFSLYCAYPMASLAGNNDLAALHEVCAHHSSLVAPRSYGSLRPAPTPEPGSLERTELFLPVPLAVRVVRRFVAETLSAWGEDALADDLVVVASELATNAVAHASCAFRVTMRLSSTAVLIAVEDRSPTLPLRLDPPEDAGGGRGILLVSSLCANWGTQPGSSGKVVWGELARSAKE
jgi:hypothetical protein